MNKQQITVTVSGCAGTGKTTVATLIQQHLAGLGFNVSYEDPDGGEIDQQPGVIKRRINAVEGKSLIVINEVQSTRKSGG